MHAGKVVKGKVDKQGRLVVPAEMRELLGMEPGTQLWLTVTDGVLNVETLAHAIGRYRGIARPPGFEGRSLVDEFIAERRAEAARE